MQIPFVGATYNGRSPRIDSSRCINFYPELSSSQDSATPVALIGTPGVVQRAYLGTSPIRGMYSFGGYLFVVSGNNLYRLDTSYRSTIVGTLATVSGPLSFADNGIAANGLGGNELAIVDGTTLYIYNIYDNKFSPVLNSYVPDNPITITYMDGYFIVSNSTMRFDVSELYDGYTFNGLAFSSVVGVPDNIQTIVNSHQLLFIIKQYSTEIFYNNGLATSQGCPFSRSPNAVLDYGTISRFSVVRGNNSIFFLATQRLNNDIGSFIGIMEMDQGGAKLISPSSINYKLSQLTNLSDAIGYCYANEGHLFYVLTFPTDNLTLVYDVQSQMFHEWSTYTNGAYTQFDSSGRISGANHSVPLTENRHLSNCYSNFNNKHVVGDYRVGNIYELSSDYYNDAGEPIISIRISESLLDKDEKNNLFITKILIDMDDPGANNGETVSNNQFVYLADGTWYANSTAPTSTNYGTTVNVSPTQVFLSWSKDAYTWSAEYPSTLFVYGDYSHRAIWRRLGYSRDKIFKLRISNSVKKVVLGAMVTVSK